MHALVLHSRILRGVGGLPTTLPNSILPRGVEKLPTNHLEVNEREFSVS